MTTAPHAAAGPPPPFRHAIARPPGPRFAAGLTTQTLGAPDLERACAEHAGYVAALTRAGVTVHVLPADDEPDSTFVEDTAVLLPGLAILTRPGAASRRAEVDAMRPTLRAHLPALSTLEGPGTLDGGDVCQVGRHFFIGLSGRTDEAGAEELAALVTRAGFSASTVDVRALAGTLHLKSALAWLGGDTLLVAEALAVHRAFARYRRLAVPAHESYAANALWLFGQELLLAAGHPETSARLARHGYRVTPLAMREFEKMDGGLSCLSLRY